MTTHLTVADIKKCKALLEANAMPGDILLPAHLTTKELAERLRRSPQTLANWRVLGEGPGFIPGRPVLYPLAEVEAWERANTVRSTTEGGSHE